MIKLKLDVKTDEWLKGKSGETMTKKISTRLRQYCGLVRVRMVGFGRRREKTS